MKYSRVSLWAFCATLGLVALHLLENINFLPPSLTNTISDSGLGFVILWIYLILFPTTLILGCIALHKSVRSREKGKILASIAIFGSILIFLAELSNITLGTS